VPQVSIAGDVAVFDVSDQLGIHPGRLRLPDWLRQLALRRRQRLSRYSTMTLDQIAALPVGNVSADPAHLYLWVPNALLPEGLAVMKAWGFNYKSNIVWHKIQPTVAGWTAIEAFTLHSGRISQKCPL
jgi:N6-adenosine-specific RNA methylase IME4